MKWKENFKIYSLSLWHLVKFSQETNGRPSLPIFFNRIVTGLFFVLTKLYFSFSRLPTSAIALFFDLLSEITIHELHTHKITIGTNTFMMLLIISHSFCSSGHLVSQSYPIGEYAAVAVGLAISVLLTLSSTLCWAKSS